MDAGVSVNLESKQTAGTMGRTSITNVKFFTAKLKGMKDANGRETVHEVDMVSYVPHRMAKFGDSITRPVKDVMDIVELNNADELGTVERMKLRAAIMPYYEVHKNGGRVDHAGTSIEDWVSSGPNDPAPVEAFKVHIKQYFHTVEQLANAVDSEISQLPAVLEPHQLRASAQRWLQWHAPAQPSDRETDLEKTVAAQAKQLSEMHAMLEELLNAKTAPAKTGDDAPARKKAA